MKLLVDNHYKNACSDDSLILRAACRKLVLEFVVKASRYAKVRAFGVKLQPSHLDVDDLRDLVEEYNLGASVESAWKSELRLPEKQAFTREHGDGVPSGWQ